MEDTFKRFERVKFVIIKKEFSTAKDFREFIRQNRSDFNDLYVKEIYNTGDAQYYESPLFLYSGYSVIMLYLFDGRVELNVYDKDFFIQHIRGDIFRETPEGEEFYYMYFPNSKIVNDHAKNINILEDSNGKIHKIDLTFKSGQHLHVEHSNLVYGTMCSYLSD